ncbi:MAG: DUF3857 domain-containing protein [Bacteroidetes bacterium]|nr:DUF3857 domain-containing protein [Bacteroidota bacterium]
MKSNHLCTIAVCLLLSLAGYAQNYFYKTYNWEKQPAVYVPTEAEKGEEYIKVKDKTVAEMAYESDGSAVIYETHHTIVHINSQKAVDRNNKIYIPTSRTYEEVDLKARCIGADGKITPFNKSAIKHVENLENMGPFTIFTIDGVDVGCDVEYLYTNKKHFYPYAMFNAQVSVPVVSYEFTVISPKNLVIEGKSYNGLSQFTKDNSDTTKNTIVLKESNLAGFTEEKYSMGEAEKKCFIIQLAYNTANGNAKFYTWETISNQYFNNLFTLEKGDKKLVEKLVDKNKIAKESTDEAKIRALESYLKSNYLISNDIPEMTFAKALDEKKLSEGDAIRFYIAALKYMNLPFELVLTTNRLDRKFDAKLPSYCFIGEILMYFPSINKYTSCTNRFTRLGYPEYNTLSNEGLFIKEVSIGEITSPSTRIKSIPANDYKESYHNMEIKVKPDFDQQTVLIDMKQILKGYSASYYQPYYSFLDNDQKKEIEKNFYVIQTESVKNFTVTNYSEEDLYMKPMIVSYIQDAPQLLENAGNKHVLKIGEIIGPQSELYQETKRQTNGDIYFTHFLKRDIEVIIPEGYTISNLNDILISKKCVIDGKDAAQFESTYKLDGNKLIITVYEDYRELRYPLKNFDDFKAVINAAADFNKKTLIFEKK